MTKLSSEWIHYDQEKKQCVHCEKKFSLSGRRDRIINHLKECGKFSKKVKDKEIPTPGWFHLTKPKTRKDYAAFVNKFSLFLFAEGVPFSVLESPLLLDALQSLDPALERLPCRQHVSTKILDELSSDIEKKTLEEVKRQDSVVLSCDSSTNIQGNQVVNFVAITKKDSYLIDCVPPNGESETAAYLLERLKEKVNELQGPMEDSPDPGRVSVVVTDNCSTNQSLWQSFRDFSPGKFAYGCVVHGLNLLKKDIFSMPTTESGIAAFKCQRLVDTLNSVKEICILFKNVKYWKAKLEMSQKSYKKRHLSLPCCTRFSSNYDCLTKFLDSYELVEQCTSSIIFTTQCPPDRRPKREDIFNKMRDPTFKKNIETALTILEIINKYTVSFQSDKALLSDVRPAFKDIYRNVSALTSITQEEKTFILLKIREREQFIVDDAHIFATLLDPRKNLTEEFTDSQFRNYKKSLINYLENHSPFETSNAQLTKEFNDYQDDLLNRARESDSLYVMILRGEISVLAYWVEQATRLPSLSFLARRLLSAPVSTAFVERTFSINRCIHNRGRNRLLDDKVKKLMIVKVNHEKVRDAPPSDSMDVIRDSLEDDEDEDTDESEDSQYFERDNDMLSGM